MSSDAARLVAMMDVRMREFELKMERAQRLTRQRTQAIQSDFTRTNAHVTAQMRAASAAVAKFAGAFGIGLSATALTRGVLAAVSSLSSLGKAARDTGLDVEELQGLMRGFARQTRISEDEATAAFERFNRRIGEAVNGAGPLNTTIERYGIRLRTANGEMRSQAELLREFAERIRTARTEQERLAIAQAAFGDSGRRMAQALAGGADAINDMVAEARTAGDIIDRNLIHRAEILDDKFDKLTRSVGRFFRSLAVGALAGGAETPLDTLVRMFGSAERAREILGDGVFDTLIAEMGELRDIDGVADGLDRVARTVEDVLQQAARTDSVVRELELAMQMLGETGARQAMAELSIELDALFDAYARGEATIDQLADGLGDVASRAQEATADVQGIDTVNFSGVMARLQGLVGQLNAVRAAAADAAAALPGGGPGPGAVTRVGSSLRAGAQRAVATTAFMAEESARAARTREQIALEREADDVMRRARANQIELTREQAEAQARLNLELAAQANTPAARGGGGGGAQSEGDFARAVAQIRERTVALEAEAAALAVAAATGMDYADAARWAAEYTRLANAAQRDGTRITPELDAQIRSLADAYVETARAAEQAATRMRSIEDRAQEGARAVADLMLAMTQGGDSARQALARLIAQLAQVQMMRAVTGLAGAGGGVGKFFSWLGGALGFAGGGYTGDGGMHEPKGVVHGGEFVFSKAATRKIGVPNLEAMHRNLRGFSQGGFVGPGTSTAGGSAGGAPVAVNITLDARGSVEGEAERFARYFDRRGRELVEAAVARGIDRRARGMA